jgi:hypothetical protein
MFTLALVAICLAACRPTCEGSGCEARYPAADLALLTGGAWPAAVDPETADQRISGRDDDGHDHALLADVDAVLVGVPAAGEVRRWDSLAFSFGAPVVLASGSAAERFGAAVAADSELLLVGAPALSAGDGLDGTGAVYAFDRGAFDATAGTALRDPVWRVIGRAAGEGLGSVVVRCGDLDADGTPDWVAAAPAADGAERLSGAIFLGLSSDGALSGDVPAERLRVLEGGGSGAAFGTSAACAHDLTGDGVADLVVGEPWSSDTLSGQGAVHVYAGGAGLPGAAPPLTFRGSAANEALGASLVTADLDGDGAPELVAGATGHSGGRGASTRAGAVSVWSGAELRARGAEASRAYLLRSTSAGAHLGSALVAADVDGDGVLDLLAGAPGLAASEGAEQAGAAYVFRGPLSDWAAELLTADADVTIGGERQYLRTGERLAAADLDADGAADLIVLIRAAADGAG